MNDIDEGRIRDIIKEELANFSPPKRKRAPNKWQVFLKDCVKEQDGGLSYPEKVKACSVKYKEKKKENNGNIPSIDQPIPQGFDMLSGKQLERLAKMSNKELSQIADQK